MSYNHPYRSASRAGSMPPDDDLAASFAQYYPTYENGAMMPCFEPGSPPPSRAPTPAPGYLDISFTPRRLEERVFNPPTPVMRPRGEPAQRPRAFGPQYAGKQRVRSVDPHALPLGQCVDPALVCPPAKRRVDYVNTSDPELYGKGHKEYTCAFGLCEERRHTVRDIEAHCRAVHWSQEERASDEIMREAWAEQKARQKAQKAENALREKTKAKAKAEVDSTYGTRQSSRLASSPRKRYA